MRDAAVTAAPARRLTIGAMRTPLAVLVELLWTYAAVAVAVQAFGRGGAAPSFSGVAAVVLGSFLLGRVLQQTELGQRSLRVAGLAVSLVALFAILHTEYAASSAPWQLGWVATLITDPGRYSTDDAEVIAGAVVLTIVWLRGIWRGQQTVDFDGVLRSAAFGMVPVAIAAASSPAARGPASFGGLGIAYVVLALCALALYQAPDDTKPISAFVAQWTAAFAGLLAIAAALAVIAAAIDPRAFGFVAPIGRPLEFVAGAFFLYVLGPVFGVFAWLLGAILPQGHHQPPQPQLPDTPLTNQDKPNGTPMWIQVVGWIVAGGALTLVGLGLMAAIWSIFRRFSKQKPKTQVRREHVDADSTLGEDVASILQAFGRRFRRASRMQASTEIRRLYAEMLEDAAALGVERPVAATPLQFAPALDQRYGCDVPSSVTRAFVASRYGNREVDAAVAAQLRERWRQVRA